MHRQGLLVVALRIHCGRPPPAGSGAPRLPARVRAQARAAPTHGTLDSPPPCKRRNPRRGCIDQKVIFKVIPCEMITSLFGQDSLRRTSKYFSAHFKHPSFFLLPSVQQRRLRLVLAGWMNRGPGMPAAAAHYESFFFTVIIFIFYHRLRYCARKTYAT